jgi:hypothetical protein
MKRMLTMGKQNPYNSLTSHEIFSGILKAVYPLYPDKEAGSHTHIYAIDKGRLLDVFKNWITDVEGAKKWKEREKVVESFTSSMCNRFLLKVGKTENFTMRLGGAKPLVVPRSTISEVFGSIGYSLFPTLRKAKEDCTEAVREIPYFFHGNPSSLFIPHLPKLIIRLLAGEIKTFPRQSKDALFLVHSMDKETEYTFYDILGEDSYTDNKIADSSSFTNRMNAIREQPLCHTTTNHLRAFFNAPVTVGVRDTLRWLNGARHPKLKWDDAKSIITDCFDKHSNENFLLPELNFYLPAPNISPADRKRIDDSNIEFLEIATDKFIKTMTPRERRFFNEEIVFDLLKDLFRYHHDYPKYRISDTMSLLSPGVAKIGLKFVQYVGYLISGVKLPDRRNINYKQFLLDSGWQQRINDKLVGKFNRRFYSKLMAFLLSYDLKGGINHEEELISYKRIDSTFFTLQERADFIPSGCKKLDEFSLEDLAKAEYSFYLRRYPELAEKLVVFFTMVLRFFNDTDFIPDLRPDEAGINIFILGIWGYITENLILTLYEDKKGEHQFRIKFVDNKDHFKQYKREMDKNNPMGLAKHAMRIVEPIVLPAMLRSVGNFVQIVHENRNGMEANKIELLGLVELGLSVAQEVLSKGLAVSTTNIQTFLADGFDDAAKFTGKTMSNIIPGVEKKKYREI